jgi:hypothetical protein
MRISSLALAVAVLSSTGCYTYQLADPGEIPVGREVRVRLSPEGAENLEAVRLTEERLMEGRLVDRQGPSMVVETAINRIDPVAGGRILTQRLTVPASDFREVEIKTLDRTRTALAAGAAAAIVGYFVASQLQDGGGSDSGPPPGPSESRRVRIPLLGLPLPF